MARQVTVTCDQLVKGRPCGKPAPDNQVTTFSLDGVEWEADLCQEHRSPLVKVVDGFASIARPGSETELPARRTRSGNYRKKHEAGAATFTASDVRAWLMDRGIVVPPSGRLKEKYMAAYAEAQLTGKQPAVEPLSTD